jgi:glycosyltransferase involved in cell wall biosynthesis
VVAVSEEASHSLKEYYSVESIVIGNAVDTDFFRREEKSAARTFFTLPRDKTEILFVGRIGSQKGEDILRKLLSRFEKEDICLVTAADKKLADSSALIHLGSIPYEQLPKLYSTADIFLLPSFHEGSAFTVLEAMSCGTPFVITETGDGSEIARFGMLKRGVVKENSSDSIYHAIKEMLSLNRLERERFEDEERHYILEKHSFPVFREKYLKLLHEEY